MAATLDEHLEVIQRGAIDVEVRAELETKLKAFLAGKRGPLRVKAGFDPTRPDLHFGHCVLMQKLRQFRELGHTVIFLVGDYTAMVGDPTGKSEARPRLTMEQVLDAAATYQTQAFKVLDAPAPDGVTLGALEIRRNSEWLGKLSPLDFIELTAKRTLARTLERRDFKQRFKEENDIYLHELLYPMLQGYDSVALDADVECGGTDQLFNLNVGRDLMPKYGKPAQCVVTTPLLEGLDAKLVDGVIVGNKMSKSADNYVGITEAPLTMIRKCMQIDDAVIWRYFELLSSRSSAEIAALKTRAESATALLDRLAPKQEFAVEMVRRFHDDAAAQHAWEEFKRVYLKLDGGGLPDNIPEHSLPGGEGGLWIAKALSATALAPSTSEGKRMVKQGQVEIDGSKIDDDTLKLQPGRYLLKTGSKNRKFAYVTVT
ncbi:MAG: tyrosine--tRNA ligase [Polyangiaceae bacterium]